MEVVILVLFTKICPNFYELDIPTSSRDIPILFLKEEYILMHLFKHFSKLEI
jgi:hypothetical protein